MDETKRRILTADETAAILRLRRHGEPMTQIAAALGLPHLQVAEACRGAGLIRVGVDLGGQRFSRWTTEEDALLRDLAGAGLPIDDLSYALSRTAQAIRKRLDHLSVPSPASPTKAEWTPENVKRLRAMVFDGLEIIDIARAFGTTPGAISTKLSKIGLRTSTRLNERERTGLADCMKNGWTSAVRISRQIGVPVEIVQHHMRMRESPAA